MVEKGWSPVEIENLISLVKQTRELYDPSSSGYSNLYTTDALWRQIADKFLNRSEPELRKKWQILRTGYRSRRHEKYARPGAKPVKKWAYFDSLMFLEPYMTDRNSTRNVKQISNDIQMPSYSEAESSSSQDVKPYLITNDALVSQGGEDNIEVYESPFINFEMDREPFSPAISETPSTPDSNTWISSKKGRKRKLNTRKTDLEKKQETTPKKSSNELFLASLLEDMNKLSPKNLRKFKISILDKLGELGD